MKKKFKLQNLDCAHCAAKMETAVAALPNIQKASVSFMMQTLTIEAEEEYIPALTEEIRAIVKRIEPDCEVK